MEQLEQIAGICPSNDWLEACCTHLRNNGHDDTADNVLHQILHSDLRDVVRLVPSPVLHDTNDSSNDQALAPPKLLRQSIQESMMNESRKVTIPSSSSFRLLVQVEELLDVSLNAETRLAIGPASPSNPTPVGNQRQRCLKLCISDGYYTSHDGVTPRRHSPQQQEDSGDDNDNNHSDQQDSLILVAMEVSPISSLSVNSKAGIKILIQGPMTIRYGIMLWHEGNATVLGGSVASLVNIQQKALEQAKKVAGVGVDPTIRALIWNPDNMGDNQDNEEQDEGEGESRDLPPAPPPLATEAIPVVGVPMNSTQQHAPTPMVVEPLQQPRMPPTTLMRQNNCNTIPTSSRPERRSLNNTTDSTEPPPAAGTVRGERPVVDLHGQHHDTTTASAPRPFSLASLSTTTATTRSSSNSNTGIPFSTTTTSTTANRNPYARKNPYESSLASTTDTAVPTTSCLPQQQQRLAPPPTPVPSLPVIQTTTTTTTTAAAATAPIGSDNDGGTTTDMIVDLITPTNQNNTNNSGADGDGDGDDDEVQFLHTQTTPAPKQQQQQQQQQHTQASVTSSVSMLSASSTTQEYETFSFSDLRIILTQARQDRTLYEQYVGKIFVISQTHQVGVHRNFNILKKKKKNKSGNKKKDKSSSTTNTKEDKYEYCMDCNFGGPPGGTEDDGKITCKIHSQNILEPHFGLSPSEMRRLNREEREKSQKLVDAGGRKVKEYLTTLTSWQMMLWHTADEFFDNGRTTIPELDGKDPILIVLKRHESSY